MEKINKSKDIKILEELKIYTEQIHALFGTLIQENVNLKEELGGKAREREIGMKVTELSLPPITENALVRAGYISVSELSKIDINYLMRVKNLGNKGLKLLNEKMKDFGYSGWDLSR